MATYKGNDIVQRDQLDEDRKLMGKRYRGFDNVDEELGLPPDATPDHVPRPGQKGYLETKPMADDRKHDVPIITYTRPGETYKAARWYADPANMREYVRPLAPGEKPNQREEPEPEGQGLQQGGPVMGNPADKLPPDEQKLRDRLNINEHMQTRDDIRIGGPGTSREGMPGPPISVTYPESPNMSQGGRVQKHGSDTCIVAKDKFS